MEREGKMSESACGRLTSFCCGVTLVGCSQMILLTGGRGMGQAVRDGVFETPTGGRGRGGS